MCSHHICWSHAKIGIDSSVWGTRGLLGIKTRKTASKGPSIKSRELLLPVDTAGVNI